MLVHHRLADTAGLVEQYAADLPVHMAHPMLWGDALTFSAPCDRCGQPVAMETAFICCAAVWCSEECCNADRDMHAQICR